MRFTRKRIAVSSGGIILLYLSLIGLISLLAPDPTITEFPSDCRGSTPNCTRVANNNIRGEGLSPVILNASLIEVQNIIIDWIQEQPRNSILLNTSTFVHAKFLTAVWRFPDDFYTLISCENTQVVVWVQSQSRLGSSDLGVNEERVTDFLNFMKNVDVKGSCS